jgi:hypothetical protein
MVGEDPVGREAVETVYRKQVVVYSKGRRMTRELVQSRRATP